LLVVTIANLVDVKGHRYLIDAIAMARKQVSEYRPNLPAMDPCEMRCAHTPRPLAFVSSSVVSGLSSTMRCSQISEADVGMQSSCRAYEHSRKRRKESQWHLLRPCQPVYRSYLLAGAVEELLTTGAGVLVPEKDATALRNALVSLTEPEVAAGLASAGRARVAAEFDVSRTVRDLVDRI
jgi:hypothetical protein